MELDNIIDYNEDEIIDYLKQNTDFINNINKKDINGNYFIQKIIIQDYCKVFQHILNVYDNLELDVIDTDERNICYYIIRFNRINFIDILLDNLDKFVGFPIFDLKDNKGFYSLSYAIYFNTTKLFTTLYNTGKVDVFKKNNNGDSLLHLAIKYKNKTIVDFLLDNNFPLHFINKNNDSIAHYFITFYHNYHNLTKIIKKLNLSIKENNFGLTTLHLISINKPLILLNLDNYTDKIVNTLDHYGNTFVSYLLVEKHFDVFNKFILKYNNLINYDLLNINGDSIINLYIDNCINYNLDIFKILIDKSNFNTQNNQGITPLQIFVKKKYNIQLLKNKLLNIFILNNDGESVLDYVDEKKNFIEIIAHFLSSILINNPDKAVIEWEKKCSVKKNCYNDILKYLIEEKSNPPFTNHDDRLIILDNDIPVRQCQYAGIYIDILFGLLYLKNNKLNILLEYPLILNNKLTEYFNTIGVDLDYKIDFINIQILWAYQKIFFPSFLNTSNDVDLIKKNKGLTIIPLGIEVENGGHANIIIIDHKNKIIERFEPYGANPPKDFNYNPHILDIILKEKFFPLGYSYLTPDEYLPSIGLQYLESLETNSCQIGDPNGFCALWCVWWALHKQININVPSNILINKLIHKLKLENYSFKNVIRNFSKRITDLRNIYLEQVELDINLWIQGKYDKKIIDKLINNIDII